MATDGRHEHPSRHGPAGRRRPRPAQCRGAGGGAGGAWRADADDLHRRRAGRADAGAQPLLRDAADLDDRAGLDAVGDSDVGGHEPVRTADRVLDRHARRCRRRRRRGLRAFCRVVRHLSRRLAPDRHLHVGAGILSLRRRRHGLGRLPAQGDFLGHGGRAPVGRDRTAACHRHDGAAAGGVLRHLSRRHRGQRARRLALSLSRHSAAEAAGQRRAAGANFCAIR